MPETITTIYFIYIFIGFYYLFLFALIYIPNRKKMFVTPEITKEYSLSIVIPCYNGERDIAKTVESLLNSDYKGLKKIIVVDDCSTDNSYKIIKDLAKKYSKVLAVQTPKNTGNAAGAKNYGAKFADTDLIGFTDDDSFPQKDAIRKMIGFFDDAKIGAVTSAVLVKNKNKFMEKLQAKEYKIIVFSRKLLSFVDAVYVTPGPLAIYRKSAFDEVGGFDESNMTEDIEITWHLISKGYVIQMSTNSKVYTMVPNKFKAWLNQRIRWNIGGIQTIKKHKKAFLKRGMLGFFILPFFISSWILGLFGVALLIYRGLRRLLFYYLSTSYSVKAQTAILTVRDINLTPNVLVFFGVTLFILGAIYTILALVYSKEENYSDFEPMNLLFYTFVYVMAYPLILLTSIYKFFRGKYNW